MVTRYRNIGRNPVHTGNGTVCLPGEVWITDIDMTGNPNLEVVKERKKVTKKKVTKKKAGKN